MRRQTLEGVSERITQCSMEGGWQVEFTVIIKDATDSSEALHVF